MPSDSRDRIDALCLEALSKDAADRAAFLDEACGGDEALRREVESLLATRSAASAVLETPAWSAPAPFAAGVRLGPYEIVSLIGAGGMGQVHKARDTRLDRIVAIKVLPPAFASDPARRARFEREAKTIAALSHPNICPLYDVARDGEVDFLVMEHLEGQTLAARLQKGKLPLDQALTIAGQIADALSAAHRHGIVHRDLKPANVMLVKAPAGGPSGPQAKLLDFGLAKIEARAGQSPGASAASVSASSLTEEGLIVGTLHYMAPEQLEGKSADAHADIWALGAILYEMLTGKRAFAGENEASVISAIMSAAPAPVSALLPTTPPALDHLITRCLAKSPDERWDSARDLADQLRTLREASGGAGADPGRARRRIPRRGRWIALGIGGLAIVAVLVAWLTRYPSSAELNAGVLTSYSGVETTPSFSPDGTKVAFVWNGDKEDNYDVYVKQIGSPGPAMPLATGPAVEWVTAWSPDDRWIAFYRWKDRRHVQIRLISPLGGLERQVAEAEIVQVRGLAWTPDAKWLIFPEPDAHRRASLTAIHVDTGERRPLTAVPARVPVTQGTGEVTGDLWPSVSRDGLALAFARGADYLYDVYVLALTPDLRPAGEPVKITSANYGMVTGVAWTADSREIVYSAGSMRVQSLWRVSASGRQAPKRLAFATPDASFPTIAPKTSRLAYVWRVFSARLWRLDTTTKERGMLAGSSYDVEFPQYSPDGSRIAFQSNRSGNVEAWVCRAEGSNCLQLTFFGGPQGGRPRWSPNGRWLALDSRAGGRSEIYVIAADGGTPRRLTSAPGFDDLTPSWSADGRWLYFTSNRTGSFEIWKVPVDGGQPEQVTRSGGRAPLASPDGKYIYYTKESGVFRISAEGGSETHVLSQSVGGNSFGVTAKGVYFIANESLQFLDTATRRVNIIALMRGRLNGMCVSPDGRYVLWSEVDRDTSDLMLVEGFR